MHYDSFHSHKWVDVFRRALKERSTVSGTLTHDLHRLRLWLEGLLFGRRSPDRDPLPSLNLALCYWLTMQRKMLWAEDLLRRNMPPLDAEGERFVAERASAFLDDFICDAMAWCERISEKRLRCLIDGFRWQGDPLQCWYRLWERTTRLWPSLDGRLARELVLDWVCEGIQARLGQEYLTLRTALLCLHYIRQGRRDELMATTARVREEFGWGILTMPPIGARCRGPWGMRADHDFKLVGSSVPPRPVDIGRFLIALATARPVRFRMVVYNCPIFEAYRLVEQRHGERVGLADQFCLLCEGHARVSSELRTPPVFVIEKAEMSERIGINSYRCSFEVLARKGLDLDRRARLRRGRKAFGRSRFDLETISFNPVPELPFDSVRYEDTA